MARVERLAAAAEVPERFEAIVEVARTTHKPKRNLQKLLDERGWQPPTLTAAPSSVTEATRRVPCQSRHDSKANGQFL